MTAVTAITRVGDRRYELRLRDSAGTVAEASRAGAALLADYLRSGQSWLTIGLVIPGRVSGRSDNRPPIRRRIAIS